MNPPTKPKPTDNRHRVVRGGCWVNTDPAWVRATFRLTYAPTNRNFSLGFRTRLSGRSPRV